MPAFHLGPVMGEEAQQELAEPGSGPAGPDAVWAWAWPSAADQALVRGGVEIGLSPVTGDLISRRPGQKIHVASLVHSIPARHRPFCMRSDPTIKVWTGGLGAKLPTGRPDLETAKRPVKLSRFMIGSTDRGA